MNTSIKLVETNADIEAVSKLAKEVWEDHYTPIIGKSQVDYMLENFQSAEAIDSQITQGQHYYLTALEQSNVGYFALIHDFEKYAVKISKIYTHSFYRGKGIGNFMLKFIEQACEDNDVSRLWLTVNKNNKDSISWYQRRGFEITEDVKIDIGSGYYMDDYVMEKTIGSLA